MHNFETVNADLFKCDFSKRDGIKICDNCESSKFIPFKILYHEFIETEKSFRNNITFE